MKLKPDPDEIFVVLAAIVAVGLMLAALLLIVDLAWMP